MKRGEHHGALRQALLAAGLALLDSEGIEGVTIRACARAAGVSHAAPGNHFADRRALLTALTIECMAELDAVTRQTLAKAPATPRARLEALFTLSVGYGLDRPHRYRLMSRADLRDENDPAMQATITRLTGPLTTLAGALTPSADRAQTLAIALGAALSGYVFMRIDGNLADDGPVSGRPRHLAMLDMLLDGALSP